MKSYRKKEPAKEHPSDAFSGKEIADPLSEAAPFFPASSLAQRKASAGSPKNLVQRKPNEKDAGTSKTAEPAISTIDSFDINSIKNEFTATVFAEAWPGQERDIAWVYYNLITQAQGEAGLKKSAAYSGKSDNYKIAMTALGDKRYGAHKPGDKWLIEKKAKSIQDYVDNNAYFKSVAEPRITSISDIVDEIIAAPATNPHPGWTGQGNLNDFNNISKPGSLYWKMARAYYWLQEGGKVTETYVKVIGAGKTVQFIFDGKMIEAYFKANPSALPATVPLYE